MKFSIILAFSLLLYLSNTFAQEITYFHKIEYVAANTKLASLLYKKLDSIKQTRRPNDSKIETLFTRDIDFGYKHQRITVTFNSIFYQVNLLVKNDSIYSSSVIFDDNFYDSAYKNFKAFKIDTSACLQYLRMRNNFYKSDKKISDLKDDLNLDEDYAFYCGDASPKTSKGKYIEELVKNKRINKLLDLVKSICCEEQAYGVAGLIMLRENKVKISADNNRLLEYIKNRNSELLICSGCLSHLLRKEFETNE
jgi:hypothetical protein